MLEKIQHICDELKNKEEIAIMKTYGNDFKRFISILLCKKIFIDIYTAQYKTKYIMATEI